MNLLLSLTTLTQDNETIFLNQFLSLMTNNYKKQIENNVLLKMTTHNIKSLFYLFFGL